MDTWVQVEKLKDGDSVNAETLNTPIDQLAARTEYLKRRLGSAIDSGLQSALIISDVSLAEDELADMEVGAVVYRAKDGFRLAQAKMHLYDDYTADESAFTIGILVRKTGAIGDVLIYGKLDIGGDPLLTAEGMLQLGEEFRSGRYYLSATERGRITSKPTGPLIYIGSFHSSRPDGFSSDAMACINPQFMDIGTSHVHRAYALVARPAGDLDPTRKSVLGYLPSEHSDNSKDYPSLIFGGTWTSTNDLTYRFMLSDSSSWGTVKLAWQSKTRDGDYKEGYKEVEIPAPGVFVDLDNGLKVKILFPEATSSAAYTSNLSTSERTWVLEFPWAGKGWVDHSVDAIASAGTGRSAAPDDTITPELHALLSGSWPAHDNAVFCAFPHKLYKKTFASTAALTTVKIDGVTYEFVSDGESSSSGNVAIDKAGTVEESLHNLAKKVNGSAESATVLVKGDTLIVCNVTLTGSTATNGSSFNVVGGTIPLMVVYSADFYVIGDVIKNKSTYTPIAIDGLTVMVYAENATTSTPGLCNPGTVLYATAYDYAPDAIYDYVMGLHQSVDYYYPPVPAQAAGLFVNGVEVESSALFPTNPTYVIGRKTLHWMEDDVGHLPWPADATTHDSVILPEDDKTMAFYFIVGFQCASGPVTSLVPAPESPIKLYTYGTNEPSYTGDLMIDAAFDFKVTDAGVKGYTVAKQGKGNKLLGGPVVEKIKGGPGVIITEAPGCPIGQGTVTVSLDNGTVKDKFNEIALENAKQEKLGLFPYVSLLGWGSSGNIPSAFTMMMRVPTSLDSDKNYKLQLRLVMFGAVGYSNPIQRVAGIQMEYNILPDYTGDEHLSLKTGLLAPSTPRQISVPFGHKNGNNYEYVAYDPFVATTDATIAKSDDVCVPFSDLPIPAQTELEDVVLKPGYLVAVRLSRTAPVNVGAGFTYEAYTGPLGFLSMEWALQEV